MTDLITGTSGALAYDVNFTGGKLVATLNDAALGASVVFSIDEKLVLNALLKLLPAGSTEAKIGNFIVSIIESASAVV